MDTTMDTTTEAGAKPTGAAPLTDGSRTLTIQTVTPALLATLAPPRAYLDALRASEIRVRGSVRGSLRESLRGSVHNTSMARESSTRSTLARSTRSLQGKSNTLRSTGESERGSADRDNTNFRTDITLTPARPGIGLDGCTTLTSTTTIIPYIPPANVSPNRGSMRNLLKSQRDSIHGTGRDSSVRGGLGSIHEGERKRRGEGRASDAVRLYGERVKRDYLMSPTNDRRSVCGGSSRARCSRARCSRARCSRARCGLVTPQFPSFTNVYGALPPPLFARVHVCGALAAGRCGRREHRRSRRERMCMAHCRSLCEHMCMAHMCMAHMFRGSHVCVSRRDP